jgi:hypothetical protein
VSRCLALGVVALAVGAVGAAASTDDVWKTLHRPLHVPKLAAGARCPTSTVDARFNFRKYGVGEGIGRGPAYPILSGGVVTLVSGAGTVFAGSAWGGQKVLWFVSPRYKGPVLIRGKRVDASGFVRFDRGKHPAAELRIPAGTSESGNPGVADRGQRYRPSYTRLRAPGCYAFQVDGTTFSRRIVFEARKDAPSQDEWTKLRRPLNLPTVVPGQPCPVSAVDEGFDFGKYGVGKGIGPGPAWPIGQPGSVLRFQYPPPPTSLIYGSEWSGNKVLWFVAPGTAGPVLVRGKRIDGSDGVRFGLALVPAGELQLIGAGDHPSTTRVRAAGCYAYQVDGPSFSYPVVFRAELSN